MTRIAVIGAGWAGLQSAALFANKYGCDVVIYEAKPSMGGTWAENTAYTELTMHSTAMCGQFIGFPHPKEMVPENRVRISQQTVNEYVHLYADKVGLTKKIRFNSKVTCMDQVSDDKVEIIVTNTATGEETQETFDYVYNTGFGSESRKPPAYPGSELFKGDVLTSHDIDAAAIEKMKQAGETVVVLGGSKASIDMLVLLHKAEIPTRWIARKTYWFMDYYRGFFDHRKTKGKLPPFRRRLHTTVAQNIAAFNLPLGIKMMRSNGVLINPHPETADKDSYHYGNIDTDMLAIAKTVPFTQGEIRELTSDGLITMKDEVVKCGTIIAAFGTDPVPLFPEFRRAGKVVDVVNAPHIYQMAIHPQLPRVYFTGPIPNKGFGMLNGYHSTQHAIILWAKKLSVAELTKRTAREEKIVRKTLKGRFNPVFQRSISDTGNIVKYLGMVDKLYNQAGYTKPLNIGLVKFVWHLFMNLKMTTVCNRDPKRLEVKKALGTSRIVKGHGLEARPSSDKLAPAVSM